MGHPVASLFGVWSGEALPPPSLSATIVPFCHVRQLWSGINPKVAARKMFVCQV